MSNYIDISVTSSILYTYISHFVCSYKYKHSHNMQTQYEKLNKLVLYLGQNISALHISQFSHSLPLSTALVVLHFSHCLLT